MARHLERMPSINEDDPFNCSVSTINRSVSTNLSFDSSQNISTRSFSFSQSTSPIFRFGSSQITSPSPQSNLPGIPNFYASRQNDSSSPGISNFYAQRDVATSNADSPGIPNFYFQRENASPGVFDFHNLWDAEPHSSDSEFENDRNAKRR